jgi:methyl-accepting chemotaxis protein
MALWNRAGRNPLDHQGPVEPEPSFAANSSEEKRAGQLVDQLSRSISTLGRDAAEVRGVLEDTQKVVVQQSAAMGALGTELNQVQRAQQAITQATDQTRTAVQRARSALEDVGAEVGGLVQSLREVSGAASDITKIALQTRLVAFNASVEAKRAGEAGRGFGVVADAVKDLASQVEQSSKAIMSTVSALDAKVEGLRRELSNDAGQAAAATSSAAAQGSSIHRSFADVERDVAMIADSAKQSQATTEQLAQRSVVLEQEVRQAMRSLEVAFAGSDKFLRLSEELIEQIASSGVRVPDALYIDAAQQGAAEISALLEQALADRQISLSELFDEHYQPIAGTNPAQHLTAFVPLADRLFPAVQERMLTLSDKVVFCIAVDRKGYVATHNKTYCQPQRAGDVVWNTAHSRYRRIFNDRTGIASATNTRPFLLQTYRRDMGGGRFVLLKEAAAPIKVQGRHWGGLRLAFSF